MSQTTHCVENYTLWIRLNTVCKMTHCVWKKHTVHKGTLSGVLFALIVREKFPSVNCFTLALLWTNIRYGWPSGSKVCFSFLPSFFSQPQFKPSDIFSIRYIQPHCIIHNWYVLPSILCVVVSRTSIIPTSSDMTPPYHAWPICVAINSVVWLCQLDTAKNIHDSNPIRYGKTISSMTDMSCHQFC